MTGKDKISIISSRPPEFSGPITVDGITYFVQTEDMGPRKNKMITRIFLKGEIVFSRDRVYTKPLTEKAMEELHDMMGSFHKATIELFKREQSATKKQKSEFFRDAQQLLRRGKGKEALTEICLGLERYPGDPFLMSYYGCLLAVVEHRYKDGVRTCREALTALKRDLPFGGEFFYPVFYLNIGRAYLAGGDKKEAVAAFHAGLKADPTNSELLSEIKNLGMRKRPPVRFLKRDNRLNKYIGMLISRASR